MKTVDEPQTLGKIAFQFAGLAFRIAAIICLFTIVLIFFNYTSESTLFISTVGTWIAVFVAELFRML